MTAKEFYNWAVENNAENLEIGVQYQDDGGTYYGDTFRDSRGTFVGIEKFAGENYILIG